MIIRKYLISALIIIIISPFNIYSQLAQGKDKFLGCSAGNIIKSNFSKYWNQITPGNAGKWGSVEGGRDSYNWSTLDKTYNYAQENNFLYKHHTLIWGNQYPTWIESLDSADQIEEIDEWIRLVGERYPEMDMIDVVNEPFNDPPPFVKALGGGGKTGWDWVVKSFELARKYCPPQAQLLINEYNIVHSNSVTTRYLALIDTLRVRGLIDGIGVQGHYFEFKGVNYTYNINTIKENLNRLTATGLPVYISEFDINEPNDNVQLENYKTYFPIFWENPGVKGITLWGYIQYDVWKPDAYLLTDRNVERPAMQWLRTYIAAPIRPVLISPNNSTTERNPLLMWHLSDSALVYNVQVSASSSFSSLLVDTSVTDTSLQLGVLDAGRRYFWRVNAQSEKGTSEYSAGNFTTNDIVEVIENNPMLKFSLSQNYPNPFNPTTTISFTLPESNQVRFVLINVLGRVVKEIAAGDFDRGIHYISLDASDLAAGAYFYRIEAGSFVDTKKILVLK